jgi:membrane protein
MVIAVGFLLLVSLVVTTAVNFIFSSEGSIWQIVNNGASLVVFALAFGLIYKVLPDTHVTWRDVWVGAVITSILFAVGKWAIGKYLGYSSVGSAYGAAGTLMVLLVWVYYTSIVFFYGAELTQISSPYLKKHLGAEKEKEEGLISDDN